MLKWHKPTEADFHKIYEAASVSGAYGNDASYVNIYLYRRKFNTELCIKDGIVLRRFTKPDGNFTYAFPLGIAAEENIETSGTLPKILAEIEADSEADGGPLSFSLLSGKQKDTINSLMPGRFSFENDRNTADYIYLSGNLAALSGGKFHKKKNHVSQFMRKHSGVQFMPITSENKKDALAVADGWFCANGGSGNADKEYELQIIREAIEKKDMLELYGGILYAENRPAAMAIASAVTEETADVHFEKALPGFDRDGAYSVINQEVAKTLTKFKYINREEDLGIEGLRKAKLSYHPDILLEKWYTA